MWTEYSLIHVTWPIFLVPLFYSHILSVILYLFISTRTPAGVMGLVSIRQQQKGLKLRTNWWAKSSLNVKFGGLIVHWLIKWYWTVTSPLQTHESTIIGTNIGKQHYFKLSTILVHLRESQYTCAVVWLDVCRTNGWGMDFQC